MTWFWQGGTGAYNDWNNWRDGAGNNGNHWTPNDNNDGGVILSGAATAASLSPSVVGYYIELGGGSLAVTGSLTRGPGIVEINGTGVLTVGGTTQLNSFGAINVGIDTISFSGRVGGTINLNGGLVGAINTSLNVLGGSTGNVTGGIVTNGEVEANAATLNVTGDVHLGQTAASNTSSLIVLNGAHAAIAGDLFVAGALANSRGEVNVAGAGSRLTVENLTLSDTTAALSGCLHWSYTGGGVASLKISSAGYVGVADTLLLDGLPNVGGLSIASGGSLEVGGTNGAPQANQLLVDAAGSIIGHGKIDVATILNNGTITAREGTLVIDSNFAAASTGEVVIDDDAIVEQDGEFYGTVRFDDDDADGHATLIIDRPGQFHGTLTRLTDRDSVEIPANALQTLLGNPVAHTEVHGSILTVTATNGATWDVPLDGVTAGHAFTIRELPNGGVGLNFLPSSSQIQTHLSGTPTGNPYLDSLIWGWAAWKPAAGPITYWFGQTADVQNATHAHGETSLIQCGQAVDAWTAQEQSAVQRALQNYAAVSGLTFQQAASAQSANITLWLSSNYATIDPNSGATSESPAQTPSGHEWIVFRHDQWTANPASLESGGDQYANLIMHELGHTLGLAHPHDGGAEPDHTNFPGVTGSGITGTDAQNQQGYTVMSYVLGLGGNTTQVSGNAATLGAFDIAALQFLYGVNNNYHTGDDYYALPTANVAGTGWTCIWDAGGSDTIDGSAAAADVTIDLRAAPLIGEHAGGFISAVEGIAGGFTIANGATIENAVGGTGNDSITGNSANNVLVGNDGDDTLIGDDGFDSLYAGGGNDVVRGGDGSDYLNGSDGSDSLYGDGGNDTADGGNEADYISGGAGTDSIYGGAGDDVVQGGADDDYVGGGNGGDTLYGDAGNDTLDGNADNDVLDGGDGQDSLYGGAGNDSLLGGLNADALIGDAGADYLFGGDGGDYLGGQADGDFMQGEAGNDTLDGGDTADYMDGGAGADSLYGGDDGDVMHGGADADYLGGQNGSDTMYGEGGNDVLDGGSDSSNDYLDGGALGDAYIFGTGMGHDVVGTFDDGGGAGFEDYIYIDHNIVANFTALSPAMSQNGANVIINLGGFGAVQINNVTLTNLGADDFIFY